MYTHTCRINTNTNIFGSKSIDLHSNYVYTYKHTSFLDECATKQQDSSVHSQQLWQPQLSKSTVDNDAQICRSFHEQNVGSIEEPSAESTRINHIKYIWTQYPYRCVYIYIYINIHIHIHMCIYVDVYMYQCKNVSIVYSS